MILKVFISQIILLTDIVSDAFQSFVSGYLMRFVLAANLLGLPAITVPVSDVHFSLRKGFCLFVTDNMMSLLVLA